MISAIDHLQLAVINATHRAKGAFSNPFRNIPQKPLWHTQLDARPLPDARYVIFFTPRSGSSRLTDLIENAGTCGIPSEYFNPMHIKSAATFLGAQGLEDYLHLLMRWKNTSGVFGCEITSDHLYSTFYSERKFFELYRPTSSVFLIRENILEQAVSLSRMYQTGLAHSTNPVEVGKGDVEFQYRPAQIRLKLLRLFFMEKRLEAIFHRNNLEPLRLSYEIITRTSPDQIVPVIADHVAAVCENSSCLESKHKKMGDELNLEYARRFSRNNSKLIEAINHRRVSTLSALSKHQARYYPER